MDYPGDILYDTTVEVLPADVSLLLPTAIYNT